MAEKNMNAKISVEFEETANRQQLSSGDNLPTLFGKIKKFFTDLKPVALSGSYNDLDDKPVVDDVLSNTSENPVQNKAIAAKIAELEGKIGGGTSGSSADIGDIKLTACSTAPSGWLICDGTAISRETYTDLFMAIGTTYGEGDGSTTFNIPDLKGKVAVGMNSAETEFNTLGKTGGEKTHRLTVSEMPSHSHSISCVYIPTSGSTSNIKVGEGYSNYITQDIKTTNPTGSDGAHNILQPYMALNYIIYTGVTG